MNWIWLNTIVALLAVGVGVGPIVVAILLDAQQSRFQRDVERDIEQLVGSHAGGRGDGRHGGQPPHGRPRTGARPQHGPARGRAGTSVARGERRDMQQVCQNRMGRDGGSTIIAVLSNAETLKDIKTLNRHPRVEPESNPSSR